MKQILMLSLMIGASLFCNAQTPNLSVRISSDTVNLENTFEIIFTVEGGQVKDFQRPDFKNFEVIYQNQSTEMNLTNGEMKQTVRYTFGLKATKEGSFAIEKASVTIKEKRYYTDFLKVVVDANYVSSEVSKAKEEDFWNPFDSTPKPTPKTPQKKERKIYKI